MSDSPQTSSRCVVIAGDPSAADFALGALACADAARHATCLLLGVDADTVAAYEPGLAAAAVDVAPDASLQAPIEILGPALVPYLAQAGAEVVLLDSSQASRDLAGWLVAGDDAVVVTAVQRAELCDDELRVTRVLNGGNALVRQRLSPRPRVVALTRASEPLSANAPASGTTPGTPELSARADGDPASVQVAVDERGLAGARIVVAVGRGIGGPQQLPLFDELARELVAALGATRAVVDRGWLPFAHQIGQTGSVVAPELYLGFGVSGAAQHLAGMRDSRIVVAVNTDVNAPLCGVADLVVNADASQVAVQLLRGIKEANGS